MRIAGGKEFDDERFAGFDIYGDFFARFQTEEKRRRRKDADVGVVLLELVVLKKNFGIEQVAEQIVAIDRVTDTLFKITAFFIKIGGGGCRAGVGRARRGR